MSDRTRLPAAGGKPGWSDFVVHKIEIGSPTGVGSGRGCGRMPHSTSEINRI